MVDMKLLSLALLALWCTNASLAHADDSDEEPLQDTPAITKGQGWMKAMLAPGGAVAAPTKEQPLEYVVINSTKACKAMKTGTAKDFKVAGKLKTCLVATYKAISPTPVEAQWTELRDGDVPAKLALFPSKYKKQLKAAATGAKIVAAHYSGAGVNMDVFLVVADARVRAIWVREEQFE